MLPPGPTPDDPAGATSVPTTIAHPQLGTFVVGLRHRAPAAPSGTAGTGRRVLLVGGTGQPPETWRDVEDALTAAGCEVATFAGRGVVPTDAPPLPWTIDDLATDTLAVLDHLGWTDPVTVVGYSLGGFCTEMLARRHPDRVAHAVLLAGHHQASAVARAARATADALAHDPAAAQAFSRFSTLVTTLDPESLAQNEALTRTWWELLDLRPRVWAAPHAERGQGQAAAGWMLGTEPRPSLEPGRVRFTLVCFDDDLLLPAGAPARVAAAELGGCPVVELPGGHGGVFTHPLETARALVEVVTG